MDTLPADFHAALEEVEINEELSSELVKSMLEEGASISVIRKIIKSKKFVECMSCPGCFENRKELIKHLNKTTHFYGVTVLDDQKKDFVMRLGENENFLGDIENFIHSEQQEINKMKNAFKVTHLLYPRMRAHEKQEYLKLLHLTLLQVQLKRSHG
jgi:uncharacterized C2H2 Zn-finger protein